MDLRYHWMILAMAALLMFAAEYRRSKTNLRFLRFAGATTKIRAITACYYALPPMIYLINGLLLWFEGAIFGRSYQAIMPQTQFLGLFAILIGILLRLWTLKTLGPAWTMSCLWWPQMPRIRRGPYRVCKHPEYLSRLLETSGVCVLFGQFPLLLANIIVQLVLISLILRIETPDIEQLRPEASQSSASQNTLQA